MHVLKNALTANLCLKEFVKPARSLAQLAKAAVTTAPNAMRPSTWLLVKVNVFALKAPFGMVKPAWSVTRPVPLVVEEHKIVPPVMRALLCKARPAFVPMICSKNSMVPVLLALLLAKPVLEVPAIALPAMMRMEGP